MRETRRNGQRMTEAEECQEEEEEEVEEEEEEVPEALPAHCTARS